MVWKQITGYDDSKDIVLSIQNTSLVTHSKVYISLTTDSAPKPNTSMVLTGPNQWTNRVPAGTRVFYAEEDGGIIGYWYHYIPKLVNYDIPFTHEDKTITNHTFTAVEGSYLTIQNKSDKTLYVSVGGTGSFVITQYQVISWTFSKDTEITLRGDSVLASISIGQSPNVTMLSKATQDMLEEMKATIDGLVKNSATKDELKTVHQRTYFGQWSPILSTSNSGNTKEIISDVFVKDTEYHSGFPSSVQMLDLYANIHYFRAEEENDRRFVEETAVVKISCMTEESGENNEVASFYCGTPWFNFNINGLEIRRDVTNGKINVRLKLKSEIKNVTSVFAIRSDECKFLRDSSGGFLNEKIAKYFIDKDNSDIHFTTPSFYIREILNLFRFGKDPQVHKSKLKTIESNENIVSGKTEDNSSYKLTTDDRSGVMEFRVPSSLGCGRILGLNIKNVNRKKKDLYFDIIVLSNGTQNKVSDNGLDVFTVPMWKHSITSFDHIKDPLKTITNSDKYIVEFVYEI